MASHPWNINTVCSIVMCTWTTLSANLLHPFLGGRFSNLRGCIVYFVLISLFSHFISCLFFPFLFEHPSLRAVLSCTFFLMFDCLSGFSRLLMITFDFIPSAKTPYTICTSLFCMELIFDFWFRAHRDNALFNHIKLWTLNHFRF